MSRADAAYDHVTRDHGYDLSQTAVIPGDHDYAIDALHDELHRRGEFGPLGRHRAGTL